MSPARGSCHEFSVAGSLVGTHNRSLIAFLQARMLAVVALMKQADKELALKDEAIEAVRRQVLS